MSKHSKNTPKEDREPVNGTERPGESLPPSRPISPSPHRNPPTNPPVDPVPGETPDEP